MISAGVAPRVRRLGAGIVYRNSVLFLLGLGVTFPAFLAPGQAAAPRLGDLALLAGLPLAVVEWRRMGPIGRAASPLAVFLFTATLLVQQIVSPQDLDAGDAAFWFRWMASAAVAPAVASLIVRDSSARRLVFAALLIGAVCHLATYGLLNLVGRDVLEAVGLASPRASASSVAAHLRLATLAEHPNAAMAMMGLAAPAALLLGERRRAGLFLITTGLCVVTIGFLATLSRGGMAAAGVAVLSRVVVGWRWRERARPLAWILAICCVATAALWVQASPADAGLERLSARFDVARLQDNAADRLSTWRDAAGRALDQPLGAGWTSASDMGAFRGQSVSHNGYLFMARTTGLLFGLALLGLHLLSAARLDALTPLSVYVLAMMFIEDLAQGGGFVFLICLAAALAWRRPVAP